jgi:hypothetical protein
MREAKIRPAAWLAVSVSVCCGVYLFFIAPRLALPHAEDEIYNLLTAISLFEKGRFDLLFSQPLYEICLQPFFRMCGTEGTGPRMLGVFSALVMFSAMGVWARVLQVKGRLNESFAVIAASGLLAVSHLLHAATMVTDRDCTVMIPLGLCALILSYAAMRVSQAWLYAVAALAWALFFWTKMSTPVIWACVWIGYAALTAPGIGKKTAAAFLPVAGGIVFALSWALVAPSLGVDFSSVFRSGLHGAAGKGFLPLHEPAYLAANLFSLFFWCTPYWLIVFVAGVWACVRRRFDDGLFDLAVLLSLSVFLYCGAVAMDSGFPKYYLPALPWLAYIAGRLFVVSGVRSVAAFSWAALSFLYFSLACSDMFYLYRVTLREALVGDAGVRSVCVMLLLECVKLFVPLLALGAWAAFARQDRRWFVGMVAVLAFSCTASYALRLRQAPYTTAYSYGERGHGAMYAYITPYLEKGMALFATKNIIYHVNKHGPFVGAQAMTDEEYVLGRIAKRDTVFVLSLPSNGTETLRMFRSGPVKTALSAGYAMRTFGSFEVWVPRID